MSFKEHFVSSTLNIFGIPEFPTLHHNMLYPFSLKLSPAWVADNKEQKYQRIDSLPN